MRCPQILAEPGAIVAYQRIGGIQNVALAAVVLFQLDDSLNMEVLLEIEHVAGACTAKGIYGLIIVADGENTVARPSQQLEPEVLQPVGVLEFVDQNVLEAGSIVLAQNLVP